MTIVIPTPVWTIQAEESGLGFKVLVTVGAHVVWSADYSPGYARNQEQAELIGLQDFGAWMAKALKKVDQLMLDEDD